MQNRSRKSIRSAERKATRINGKIRYFNQVLDGRVVDLSPLGLALEFGGGAFHAAEGSPVCIESPELGNLDGLVKWKRNGRVGIKFNANSNACAKITAYFRFFHHDRKPVLSRENLPG